VPRVHPRALPPRRAPSVFIEPTEELELNNEIRSLQFGSKEIDRISVPTGQVVSGGSDRCEPPDTSPRSTRSLQTRAIDRSALRTSGDADGAAAPISLNKTTRARHTHTHRRSGPSALT